MAHQGAGVLQQGPALEGEGGRQGLQGGAGLGDHGGGGRGVLPGGSGGEEQGKAQAEEQRPPASGDGGGSRGLGGTDNGTQFHIRLLLGGTPGERTP